MPRNPNKHVPRCICAKCEEARATKAAAADKTSKQPEVGSNPRCPVCLGIRPPHNVAPTSVRSTDWVAVLDDALIAVADMEARAHHNRQFELRYDLQTLHIRLTKLRAEIRSTATKQISE